MKKKALASIKKNIERLLDKTDPSASSIIRCYLNGSNFNNFRFLHCQMIRKINATAIKELGGVLVDPKKFEKVFTYDLLIGDRNIYDQHTVDSDPKIDLFMGVGVEFKSSDFQAALRDSYITLFLLGRESSANVIMITGAHGVSISYKLFSRVNTKERNTCFEVFQQKAA